MVANAKLMINDALDAGPIGNADGDIDMSGFTPGETYTFSIQAYQDNGGTYSWSTAVTADGEQTSVSNFTAIAQDGEIVLNWDLPSQNGCFSNVIIAGRQNASPVEAGVNASAFANNSGNSAADYVAVTGNDWSLRDNTANDFNNLMSDESAGSIGNDRNYVVYNGNNTTETITITGLTNNTDYQFKIFLFNDGSPDEASGDVDGNINIEDIEARADPEPVSALDVTCESADVITLSWSEPAKDDTGLGYEWDGILVYALEGGAPTQTFTGENVPSEAPDGFYVSVQPARTDN